MNDSFMQPLAGWLAGHPLAASSASVVVAMLLSALFWKLAAGEGGRRQRLILFWSFAATACAVFLVLAIGVRGDSGVVVFDRALAADLGVSMAPPVLSALSLFTHLGDRNLLIVVVGVVLLVLAWRRLWVLAGMWVASTLGGSLINVALKHMFSRVRPEYLQGFAHETGFSFPSGHASGSIVVYGAIIYLLLRLLSPSKRLPALMVGVGLITAIGASRVMLRAHFFSDVVAGWAITSIWLAICVAVTEHIMRRRAQDGAVGHAHPGKWGA